MDGRCPVCKGSGEINAPCAQPGCETLQLHFVPVEYVGEGAPKDPVIGRSISDYLVVDLLGRGGFGKVLLALQMPIRMKAALKLMTLDGENADAALELLKKFEGEAQALATLNHPNIVRLVKYGAWQGAPYLVMEHVPGGHTLKRELNQRKEDQAKFTLKECVHVIRQLLDGLEAAHGMGIVHRDIKPENVMLQEVAGNKYFVRLVDFGLAKFVADESGTTLAMGTPTYMAPEQLTAGEVGPWTDLYALGWITLMLLTGKKAYDGSTRNQIVAYKLAGKGGLAQAAPNVKLPVPLLEFLEKATANDPAARFRSCEEFRDGFTAAVTQMARLRDAARAAAAPKKAPPSGGPTLAAPPAGAQQVAAPAAELERDVAEAKRLAAAQEQVFTEQKKTDPEPPPESGPSWYDPAVSHAESEKRRQRADKSSSKLGLIVGGLVTAAVVVGLVVAMNRDKSPQAPAPQDAGNDTSQAGNSRSPQAGTAGLQWMPVNGSGAFKYKSAEGAPRNERVTHFWLAQTETTVAQYRQCVDAAACTEPESTYNAAISFGDQNNWGAPGRDAHPVNGVDWKQARAFCTWAGGRLPTEAEWEWAAQSGAKRSDYPWGAEAPSCERVVMADGPKGGCGGGFTQPTCSRTAGNSADGVCDLLGNVKEWTADWLTSDSNGAVPAKEPPNGARAIARGPQFVNDSDAITAPAWREALARAPSTHMSSIGFRCAR